MEKSTRPGENTRIHVSLAQLVGIKGSLRKHLHLKLQEKFAQLDSMGIDADVQLMKGKLVDDIEGEFLDSLMDQLEMSVVIDDGNVYENGDDHDAIENEKTEPYDFALNDKLRATYQEFEDNVEKTCKLRLATPALVGTALSNKLQNDIEQLQSLISQHSDQTKSILDSTENINSPDTNTDIETDTLNSLHKVKNDIQQTVLNTETISRVAHFR